MIFNQVADDRKVRVFSLSRDFIDKYRGRQPKWGPVGLFTYKRTYSRALPDGGMEEFWQTCQRVVEGCFQIQKVHCRQMGLPWSEPKAQRSAQDMYDRMWNFKFLPPGRGLWMMGTDTVFQKGSACLLNCAFTSTENLAEDFAAPFCFLMDMSMLGVGVGGDTRGVGRVRIQVPKTTDVPFVVDDSREGWVELVRAILNPFVGKGLYPLVIDFTRVRGRGAPIKGFGGTASGPTPLQALVRGITKILMPEGAQVRFHIMEQDKAKGTIGRVRVSFIVPEGVSSYRISSAQIVDVFNNIGKCLPGDAWVLTTEGPRQVKHLVGKRVGLIVNGRVYPMESDGFFQTGEKQVYKLITEQGWTLRLTHDHRVMTGEGEWVEAGSLNPGDTIRLHEHQGVRWGGPGTREQGYVLGHLVGDGSIREVKWGERGQLAQLFTWDQDEGTEEVRHYTERVVSTLPHRSDWSGWRYNGGEGRQVMSSVALTGLAAEFGITKGNKTLTLQVEAASSGFQEGFLQGLFDADGSVNPNTRSITLSQSNHSLLQGVQRMLGRLGVLSSVYPAGRPGEFVLYVGGVDAEVFMSRVGFKNTRKAAQYRTKPWIRGPYQREPAAVVKSLEPDGVEPVYDVTVADVHAFDANGLYVHNCVVAGGVRRTAEIMFGEPDDAEFVTLKQDAEALKDRRWASNNSVFGYVGMDYSQVARSVATNGEPGILWLENARRFSRMNGVEDNKDWRVMGSNPCVTGDTLVLTTRGPRRIDTLLEKPFSVVVDGKVHRCETGAFQTGVRPVYLLQTEEGHSLRVTADHQIQMSPKITVKKRYEMWVPAEDLVSGDRVVLNNARVCEDGQGNAAPLEWAGMGTGEQGWLLGSLLGDGHIRSGEMAVLQFWGPNKESLLGRALKFIEALGGDPRYHKQRTGTEVADRDMVSTRSVQLLGVAREFGIADNKDIASDVMLMASSAFQAGFLRGLFDADGSVQGKQEKGVSVRLSSSRPQHLLVAQRMLLHFGINSTIYWNRRDAGETLLPDGKGGSALYHTKAQHELLVSKDNLQVFADRVGFADSHKAVQLQAVLDGYSRAPNRDRFVATVKSLTYVGVEPVFDCTIEGAHCFGANGVVVHNCGEQPLESFELCVGGDTQIQLKNGVGRIQDLVGQNVQVWNGDNWSTVTPRVTGEGRELFRVTLSDGSFLDCTENHGWHVLPKGKRVFRRVETSALCSGSQVIPFEIDAPVEGTFNPIAFETGLFTGDGFLNRTGEYTYPVVAVCGEKAKLRDLDVQGVWWKPQDVEGYAEPVNRLSLHELLPVGEAERLNNKSVGLTDAVFGMDQESILEFVAGWIESDGAITNKGSRAEGYRVYGAEPKIRDLQLLLRRVGINHSTVRLFAEAGSETNFGTRNYALWYCQIPSFECGSIPTRIKVLRNIGLRLARNNAHPEGAPIDRARKQKVVKVERIPGTHTTYCFDEPENHMAVFGNALTYQCNLVETFPAHHDDYDDFQRTLKMAYLYAKTVTLVPTHDLRANAVMTRNRRIGCSMSGIIQAMFRHGRRRFLTWCGKGYEYIQQLDRIYSDWLGVPLSRKTTTVKPSGCRPWYALTATDKGLLTLEDLFGEHPIGDEWAQAPMGMQALGSGRVTRTYDNGVAPVFRITTSYGIEVESTPNHQWWVAERYDRSKSQKYQPVNEWRRTDEIQPGDILDINPGVYNREGGVKLASLNSLALNMRGGATEIQQPTHMNPRLAWLLGYLWGDGAMSPSKYRLRWVDARRNNLEKTQDILKEQFGLSVPIRQASGHRRAETLEVGSKHLWHWLIRNDVFKLYTDKIDIIPKIVRASGQEDILAFLAGLLDADGWAGLTAQGAKLVWTMADGFFARHVQDVALAVGLVLGRSHVVGGSSFQNRRSMYHLTQSAHVNERAFGLFRRHSTKVADVEAHPDFHGWHCERKRVTSGRLILGKVIRVESVGEMPTYDIEVEGTHWYYAGALRSHNTTSLLCGATPGIHYPHSEFYIRNIRVANTSPLVGAAGKAGYKVEPDTYADDTSVISFPVRERLFTKGKCEVSIWEQFCNAADMQRHWSDNAVSVTMTFRPEEVRDIQPCLEAFEDRLKGVSMLPLDDADHGYAQPPYQAIPEKVYDEVVARVSPMQFDEAQHEIDDKFCSGDHCQIRH